VAYVERLDTEVDGLWLISPGDHTVPPGTWSQFFVGRHGFYSGSDATEVMSGKVCSSALVVTPEHPSLGILDNVRVHVEGKGEVNEGYPYRLMIVPEQLTTYFPMALFQRYFDGHNIFADNPTEWPSLEIVSQDGCRFVWRGETLLPRSVMMPGGTNLPNEPVLRTLFNEKVQSDSEGEITLGHALRGYNSLKVHPHNNDNSTIIVGGNVLWASSALFIDQSEGSARLVSDAHLRHITILDALWLILLCVTYIRWKFAGSWLDSCEREDHFNVIVTRVSILTSVSLFTSKLASYLFYVPLLLPLHRKTDAFVIYAGLVVDIIVGVLILVSLRAEVLGAMRDTMRTARELWLYLRGHVHSLPSSMPVIKERLECSKHWDPASVYGRKRQNRDFVWFDMDFYVFYVILIDIVFATTAWVTVTPFEDRLFADIIVFLAFSAAIYEVLYFMLLLATALFVPRSKCALRLQFFALVPCAIASIGLVVFAGVCVIYRIIDDYSTMYEGRVLVFVTIFYILVLLFLASLMARSNLHSNIVALTKNGKHATGK